MYWQNWCVLIALPLSGCLLGVDKLEAGVDDIDDTSEVDGDSADWGESIACLDGSTLPGQADLPAPDCEVDCETGWGHGTPTLASEWTLELDVAVPAISERWDQLITLIDGSVLIAVSGDPVQFVWVSPDGEQYADLAQSYSGRVFDLDTAPDGGGDIYVLWENDEGVMSMSSSYDLGEWTVEIGSPVDAYPKMVALDQGKVAAVYNLPMPATPVAAAEVVWVVGGEIVETALVPESMEIAKGSNGDVVLANHESVSWVSGDFIAQTAMPDLAHTLGLVAVDDESVVIAGAIVDPNDAGGSLSGLVREVDQAGLGWSATYDRAESWCPTNAPTNEMFVDLERLPDGSLIVGGFESPEYPFGDEPSYQPWVAHVSATGDVLAVDRGSWIGRVISISANEDAAYVLMSERQAEGDRLFVRKYPL